MGERKICGLYSITRGLGFHGDKQVKKFISAKPSVSTYKLESHYSALIIATKGLWSVLSYEQVAELVIQVEINTSINIYSTIECSLSYFYFRVYRRLRRSSNMKET